MIGLAKALPVFLLAIPGGHLADRFDRRRVLTITLGLGAMMSAALATAVWLEAPVWMLYPLLMLLATGQALGGPSRASLMPLLLPAEHLTNGVTWNSTLFQTATMIGPAVGGLLLGKGEGAAMRNSVVLVLALAAAFRGASVLAVAMIGPTHQTPSKEPVTLSSVLAGVRFVLESKLILAAISLDMFAVLLGGATYLLPVFATDILQVGPGGVGYLRAAEAVGAIGMGLVVAHLPEFKRPGRAMLLGVVGFGVATIIFGLSRWFWLSMACMVLIGMMDNISVVVRHSLVQMLTPDAMRGRVSAVNNIFIVASNDLGGMESGLTAGLFSWLISLWWIDAALLGTQGAKQEAGIYGSILSVVFGGICTLLVVLIVTRIWPQVAAIGPLRHMQAGPGK